MSDELRRADVHDPAPVRWPKQETTAAVTTRRLRNSDDPVFVVLRAELAKRAVDVERDVLVDFHEDDPDQDFGVVVTHERRIFWFNLWYSNDDRIVDDQTQIRDWTEATGKPDAPGHEMSHYLSEAHGLLGAHDGVVLKSARRRALWRIRRWRLPVLDELRYLRSVEAAAHAVADEALDEGWLDYSEDQAPATPLHASVNELARRLRHTHHNGDGCLDHHADSGDGDSENG